MKPDTDPHDEEYVMPCAEALLAGTLALMTGHAQSDCARQRMLMAHKICANLGILGQKSDLTPNFRTVVLRLHRHWDALATDLKPAARQMLHHDTLLPETQFWHPVAARVQ
jgi:hypothetical protein